MFYTYILKSEVNNSYYVGSCGDMAARIKRHNNGLVKSTKRYKPWTLILVEEYNILRYARKRERQIKSWKKRSAIERLIKASKILNK